MTLLFSATYVFSDIKTPRGGFQKPIYALRQTLTLFAKLLRLKKLRKKFSVERKMDLHPTLSLYEIDPDCNKLKLLYP